MRRLAYLACSATALVTPRRRPLLHKQPAFHRPTALHAFDPATVAAFDPSKFAPVCTASDAIILAGSAAVPQLGLDTGMLLLLCANKPAAAREVIAQCQPHGQCLHGVPPVTLIETGLKAIHLNRLGYDAASVREQTLADPSQMGRLGF